MRSRISLIALGIVTVVLVTAFFSARAGYAAAQIDSGFSGGGSDGVELVSALESLRAGQASSAEKLLESKLDGVLIARYIRDRRSSHLVSLARPADFPSENHLLGQAAQYRAGHPSAHPDATVRRHIGEVVEKYKAFAMSPETSPN